jgi:hypothetical protein
VNRAIPVEFVPSVLIVIARTARVARFIRTWALVKNSSRLNLYWIMQHLNPFFYIDKCCRDPPLEDSSEKDITNPSNATTQAPAVGPNAMRRQNSQNSILSSSKLSRHTSIQTSLGSGESTAGNGVRFRSVLRKLGMKTAEAERQGAARLIQRSWRASNKRAKISQAQVKNGGNKEDASVKGGALTPYTKRRNQSQVGFAITELT